MVVKFALPTVEPQLTTLTPSTAASNAGDLPVLITGANFRASITATLGNTALLSVTLESPTTLHAVVPVGSLAEGAYTLTITSAGRALTLTHAFTVTAPVAPTQFRGMVVLACDNNLETHCRRLVNDLELAMLSNPDLRLVVLWDGRADGDSAYMLILPDADPYAWAAYEDGVTRFPLGEVDTGDASTLVTFAAWAQAQYPGHYTLLSLVGHGGGWTPDLFPPQPREYEFGPGGLLWDDHAQSTLGTRRLRDALAWLTAASRLDVIYLDACLMAQTEVLAEIGFAGDYVIAHENLTWSRYPYAEYLGAITAATTPSAFTQNVAQVYRDAVLAQGYPGQIAVWPTASLAATILPALDTLSLELLAVLPTHTLTLRGILTAVAHVDENTDGRIDAADSYVDLYDLARQLSLSPAMPQSVKDAAQALMTALTASGALNYTRSGFPFTLPGAAYWDLSALRGLSLYAPLADEWRRALYTANALPTFAAVTHWDEVVQALYAGQTPPETPGDPEPPAPLGDMLWLPTLNEVGVNQVIYVPVWGVVQTISGVVTVQFTVTSSNVAIAAPAAALSPRFFTADGPALFPTDSLTYTAATADGWGVMLTLPVGHAPISGTGILAELPFRVGESVGCADLRFANHLMVDGNARAITHAAIAGRVCTTDTGAADDVAWLQARGPVGGIAATLSGPGGIFTATSGAQGRLVFNDVLSGSYTLTATHPLHLTAVRDVTVTGGFTTSLSFGLWAGDMDANAAIETRDWTICAAASVPVNDPAFDLNGDGQTDATDCTRLWLNIGVADPRLDPPQPAAAAQSAPRLASASAQAAEFALTDDAAQTWRLQADFTGNLQAIGARIILPPGAQASVEALPDFAGGVYWHQDGATLYLVAVAAEAQTGHAEVARLQLTAVLPDSVLTLAASNLVGEPGQPVTGEARVTPEIKVFLPLIRR